MIYEYWCDECGMVLERDFDFGKPAKKIECPECSNKCERHYGNMNFVLTGAPGEWPSKKLRFNREMTQRNEDAGKRMRKNREPIKTVAHDYGNGDVREVT